MAAHAIIKIDLSPFPFGAVVAPPRPTARPVVTQPLTDAMASATIDGSRPQTLHGPARSAELLAG